MNIFEIVKQFNHSVFKLIKIAKRYEPKNPNVIWLQDRLTAIRQVDELFIINKCKDKLWTYREQIANRDINFFMNHGYEKFIKEDGNKAFMYTLMNTVKDRIAQMDADELTEVWSVMDNMLLNVVRYLKITGDYSPAKV